MSDRTGRRATKEGAGGSGRRSRDDVIRAAGRLFAERGFHGTSMRDLGDALGLHGSSLYAHIGSKNELLEEIVSTGVRHCLHLAEEVLASDDPPSEKLRRLVVGHVGLVVANLDTWATFVNEYRFLPEPQRDRVVELRDRYEGAFRAVVKEAVADGSARDGIDERVVATLVLSQLNALPGWYRPGGRQSAAELGETMYELAIRGIGA